MPPFTCILFCSCRKVGTSTSLGLVKVHTVADLVFVQGFACYFEYPIQPPCFLTISSLSLSLHAKT